MRAFLLSVVSLTLSVWSLDRAPVDHVDGWLVMGMVALVIGVLTALVAVVRLATVLRRSLDELRSLSDRRASAMVPVRVAAPVLHVAIAERPVRRIVMVRR